MLEPLLPMVDAFAWAGTLAVLAWMASMGNLPCVVVCVCVWVCVCGWGLSSLLETQSASLSSHQVIDRHSLMSCISGWFFTGSAQADLRNCTYIKSMIKHILGIEENIGSPNRVGARGYQSALSGSVHKRNLHNVKEQIFPEVNIIPTCLNGNSST